ncbi:MAG: hypothetical protein AAGJ35_16145, partial [Myxococcota bacterium]
MRNFNLLPFFWPVYILYLSVTSWGWAQSSQPTHAKHIHSSTASTHSGPFSRALLLNGGGHPRINYYSHLLHLRMMRKALQERGVHDKSITILSADGEDP